MKADNIHLGMEEGRFHRFRKNKAETNIARWTYETQFREYAFLLGRKAEHGLESIKNLPERLELGGVWHKALNRMRDATRFDKKERYALITFEDSTRDFYFPETVGIGEPANVPSGVIAEEFRKARDDQKVTSVIGDIHTHPGNSPFSYKDMLIILNPHRIPQLMISGVTTDELNIFALRTRETEMITKFDTTSKAFQDFFRKYWAERSGFKVVGPDRKLQPVQQTANIWNIPCGIAERHNLAIYSGKPNEDLHRIRME